jgi:integrase
MASITKTDKGYRAQIYVKGVRESRVLRTEREAKAWAAQRETELRAQTTAAKGQFYTLLDALHRYRDEVTPRKRGARWEEIRLAYFERQPLMPINKRIGQITTEDISGWRDERGKSVSSSSVTRELNLLSAVFETARREWRWIDASPVRDVRRPRQAQHRDKVFSWREIRSILRALRYTKPSSPVAKSQIVAVCFLLALRTGMRAGEITGLEWADIFPHHCRLHTTKTGEPRDVPLPYKARRLIELMRGHGSTRVFNVSAATRDVVFRRATAKAGVDCTFHDSRHTAATWIGRSGKWELLEMCRAFGWRDPKYALVYFNPTAEDLAKRFNAQK